MSDERPTDPETLHATAAERVERDDDRFEAAWRCGRRPRIEEYLGDAAGPERAALLRELLATELKWRRRRGERPDPQDYRERFPGHAALIESAFAEARAAAALPSFGAMPAQLGRYLLKRRLGGGGMGDVYLAHDESLDRAVALKVPRGPVDEGGKVLDRFFQEARAVARIHHPYICPVYDIGEIGGFNFLTMPYIEGRTLRDRIRAEGPWPQARAAALVRQLALAVAEAHRLDVAHRDLKPDNVMMKPDGEPVLIDFGLARRVTQEGERLTIAGIPFGTPAYMAPEQVRGDLPDIGPAADIYSLGVILYELLTGRVPFEGELTAILARILTEEADPPSKHRPDLAPALDALCRQAMAKEPAGRHASARQLADELQRFLDEETIRPEARETMFGRGAGPGGPPSPPSPPALGSLRVEFDPPAPGASITWEEKAVVIIDPANEEETIADVRPGEPLELPPGDYRLRIIGEDYKTEQPLALREGMSPDLHLQLLDYRPIRTELSEIVDVAFRPDGQCFAVFGRPRSDSDLRTVEVWDVETDELRFTCQTPGPHGLHVYPDDFAFSPDGTRMAGVYYDGTLYIWDAQTGREIHRLMGPDDQWNHVAFSPDGRRLISHAATGGFLTIRDVETGRELATLEVADDTTKGAAFSRDGKHLIVLDWNGSGTVHDAQTGKKRMTLFKSQHVSAMALDASGRRLATGDFYDGTVRLWDMEERRDEPLFTLRGRVFTRCYGDAIESLAFSPDGRFLASGGRDCSIRFWDAQTGRGVLTIDGWVERKRRRMAQIKGVAFSPDGKHLLTGAAVDSNDSDGKVRLWTSPAWPQPTV